MLSATVVVLLGATLIVGLIGTSLYFFAEHNLLIHFTYPLIELVDLSRAPIVNYFRDRSNASRTAPPSLLSVAAHGRTACALAGKPCSAARSVA